MPLCVFMNNSQNLKSSGFPTKCFFGFWENLGKYTGVCLECEHKLLWVLEQKKVEANCLKKAHKDKSEPYVVPFFHILDWRTKCSMLYCVGEVWGNNWRRLGAQVPTCPPPSPGFLAVRLRMTRFWSVGYKLKWCKPLQGLVLKMILHIPLALSSLTAATLEAMCANWLVQEGSSPDPELLLKEPPNLHQKGCKHKTSLCCAKPLKCGGWIVTAHNLFWPNTQLSLIMLMGVSILKDNLAKPSEF